MILFPLIVSAIFFTLAGFAGEAAVQAPDPARKREMASAFLGYAVIAGVALVWAAWMGW